jgi:tungstate transport system substrate-binding protein
VLDELGRSTSRAFRPELAGGAATGDQPAAERAAGRKASHGELRGGDRPSGGPSDRPSGGPAGEVIVIASSTEPVDSGLLEALESAFRADTGLTVRHIAAGSGQAHRLAEAGRADAVLSHAPELEQGFMERGIGVRRTPFMKNSYLLLGPHSDPAGLRLLAPEATLADMFARIAEQEAPFVSRNDYSGTHLKELALWNAVGVSPPLAQPETNPATHGWYYTPADAGGSAAAVRCAVRLGAYTLSDSATSSRHIELRRFIPATSPDEENVFSLLVVDAAHVPGANTETALRLAEWLGSERAQSLIAAYGGPAALFRPIA